MTHYVNLASDVSLQLTTVKLKVIIGKKVFPTLIDLQFSKYFVTLEASPTHDRNPIPACDAICDLVSVSFF